MIEFLIDVFWWLVFIFCLFPLLYLIASLWDREK
jgi:hypothetical protein